MSKVKHYITDALFVLLEKKEMGDITITDVITKAGVCRASFYRNFLSLNDVIKQYIDSLFDKMSGNMQITMDNTFEHSKFVYLVLLSEKTHLKTIEKRDLLFMVDEGFYSLCSKQFEKLGMSADEYRISFFAGASAFVTRTWIKNDFKESPEELTKMLYEIIVKIGKK